MTGNGAATNNPATMQDNPAMSANRGPGDAIEQLPADVAGKSAGQIEGILEMIDSGEISATAGQRAYLAGAAAACRAMAGG